MSRLLAAAGEHVNPDAVSNLIEELAGLLDQMDQLASRLTDMIDVEHVGDAANGQVRAVCNGSGDLVSLTYGVAWCSQTPGRTIGQETTRAVRAAAVAAQESAQAESLGSVTPLSSFLADPERIGASLREGA